MILAKRKSLSETCIFGKTHKLSFFGGIFFQSLAMYYCQKGYIRKTKRKKSVRGMIQLLSKGMIFVALFLATIFFLYVLKVI